MEGKEGWWEGYGAYGRCIRRGREGWGREDGREERKGRWSSLPGMAEFGVMEEEDSICVPSSHQLILPSHTRGTVQISLHHRPHPLIRQ